MRFPTGKDDSAEQPNYLSPLSATRLHLDASLQTAAAIAGERLVAFGDRDAPSPPAVRLAPVAEVDDDAADRSVVVPLRRSDLPTWTGRAS